jgi:TetR/AcrR family transcriptional regulator
MKSIDQRREEEKEERRRAILDAARKLFAKNGVEHTTMGQIAIATRLSRGLIYFYFEDREHVYMSVVEEALIEIYSYLLDSIEMHTTGIERVKALGNAYIQFSTTRPDFYAALFRFQSYTIPSQGETSSDEKPHSIVKTLRSIAEITNKINSLTAEQISLGIEDKTIREDVIDPVDAALFLWSATSGLIQTYETKKELFISHYNIPAEKFYKNGIDMLTGSLKKQAV